MLSVNSPEIIALCLECDVSNCKGFCERVKNALGSETREIMTITYMGETLTIREWADRLGISRKTLYNRIRRGCTTEDALKIKSDLTAEDINNTNRIMATMHINYTWYMNRPDINSSRGMIARYGEIATQKTLTVGKPTEQRALSDLMLTDEQKETLAWIQIVLVVQERYRMHLYKGRKSWRDDAMAEIIEHKVLQGWTLHRVMENLDMDEDTIGPVQIKNMYNRVIEDIAREAKKHGLLAAKNKKSPGP